ncbi:MAG: LD-carboxypeptidase [Balneolales bacterium]
MPHLHPLPPKGTIGIMAPSSPVEEDKLQNGIRYFEKMGYKTITKSSCFARDHYLAGSAEQRASDLMELVHSPEVDAIFFARGGFGSAAMLPLLDYPSIRKSRKLMVGYSDITALQWGIYAKTGLPSLSAGMPATDFNTSPVHPQFEKSFWNFMETGKIDFHLNVPCNKQSGTIRGKALPGTLSVATKLSGSPYFPALDRTILIFEDVGEPRHKIEGYLWQARLSGWFDRCNAVILGDFSKPEKETFPDSPPLEEIFARVFHGFDLPVITGVPYGHIDHKIPFPVGVEISLSFGLTIQISSIDTLFDS